MNTQALSTNAKALLVGINAYSQASLRGCVNDVQTMSTLFKSKGWTVDVLTDKMATKQNILEQFEALLHNSKKGDIRIFHFSGHGSQVPDKSGDEKDGLDECLLPIDFTWDNVILDDDLDRLLAGREAHVEVILDACHSGSGTRSVLFPGIETEQTTRFIQPPMELFEHIVNPDLCVAKQIRPKNVVTWSGCRDDQTSADASIEGNYNGIFTFALSKELAKNQSRKCTIENVRKFIANHAYSQIPQLDCKYAQTGTEVFSTKTSLLKSIFNRC